MHEADKDGPWATWMHFSERNARPGGHAGSSGARLPTRMQAYKRRRRRVMPPDVARLGDQLGEAIDQHRPAGKALSSLGRSRMSIGR